jgi:hypothetical protein
MKRYSIHLLNLSVSFFLLIGAAMADARPDAAEHGWIIVCLLVAAALYLCIEMGCLLDISRP